MNDWSVMYIEKDVIDNIDSKTIIQWFQNMKTCRMKIFIFMYLHFFFSNVNIFKFYFYYLNKYLSSSFIFINLK